MYVRRAAPHSPVCNGPTIPKRKIVIGMYLSFSLLKSFGLVWDSYYNECTIWSHESLSQLGNDSCWLHGIEPLHAADGSIGRNNAREIRADSAAKQSRRKDRLLDPGRRSATYIWVPCRHPSGVGATGYSYTHDDMNDLLQSTYIHTYIRPYIAYYWNIILLGPWTVDSGVLSGHVTLLPRL